MKLNSNTGKHCRKRYRAEYQSPRINIGKQDHHTSISGKVIACRMEFNCQGNGAKRRFAIPMGMVLRAPEAVDTSLPRPKPESADCAESERLACTMRNEPKLSK